MKSDPRKYQKRSGRTVSEAREANYSIFNEEVTDWPIEAHSFWGPSEEHSVGSAVNSDMVWHMCSLKKALYYTKTCNKTTGLVGIKMKSGARYSKPYQSHIKKIGCLNMSTVSHMSNG